MRRLGVGSRLLDARTLISSSQNNRAGSLGSRIFSSTTCAAVGSTGMSPLSPESAVCTISITRISILKVSRCGAKLTLDRKQSQDYAHTSLLPAVMIQYHLLGEQQC